MRSADVQPVIDYKSGLRLSIESGSSRKYTQ